MIERVLEKLGAINDRLHASDAWLLKRLGSHIFWEGGDLCDGDQWLLMGEITEALKEGADVYVIEQEMRGGWPKALATYGVQDKVFQSDSLFDCYIQAADELLQPAEEGKE